LVTALVAGLGIYWFRAEPPTPFERGVILMNEGEVGLAGTEFLAVAKANRDGRAYAFAAYCLAELNFFDEATFSADNAIELGFTEAWVYNNRAYSRWRRKQLAAARQDCDTALALAPDRLETRFIRASIALDQNRPDQTAIDDINAVRRDGSRAPDASRLAASLYVARGGEANLREAAAAILEAVARGDDPKQIRRIRQLAEALAEQDDFKKAIATEGNVRVVDITPCLIRPRE